MKTFWAFAVTLLAVQGVYGQANLSGTSATVAAAAGGSSFSLTLNPAAAWTATSTATWLTVTPTSGSASAVISYTYTANTGTPARQARIDVAGLSFYVIQLGVGGAYTAWGSTVYGYLYQIAGNNTGVASGDGGIATAAGFAGPSGAALDANGNLIIVDALGNSVRRVDASSGLISTIAGTGVQSYSGDGGAATAATLSGPNSVAIDRSGNILVADNGNNRIRRIDAVSGVIITVAGNGSGTFSGDGAAATAAGIPSPLGVIADAAGNIYISDIQYIRRVDAVSGIITTIAGNGAAGYSGDGGPATSASLYVPTRMAIDASGNLLINDLYNARIRRVNIATGIISTVAGGGTGGDGGPASSAKLFEPNGVAVDLAGNIFIAESQDVRRVDAITGIITTVAGGQYIANPTGAGNPATTVSFAGASDVATDAAGSLYIVNGFGIHGVLFVDFATARLALSAGAASAGPSAGTGSLAFTIAPAGSIWEAFSTVSWLTLTTTIGTGSGSLAYSFSANPSLSSRTASVFINGQSFLVTQAGAAVTLSASSTTVPAAAGGANFSLTVTPAAAWTAVSSATWLTVTPTSGSAGAVINYTYTANTSTAARQARIDVAGHSFYVIQLGSGGAYSAWGSTAYGHIYTIAGGGAGAYPGDGQLGTAVQLGGPVGVALDADGNVYFSDGDRVRRLDAVTGIISTVAGSMSCLVAGGVGAALGDGGPATTAKLCYPAGVAVDRSGNIFIADSSNNRVRRVDAATGVITTVAGNGSTGSTGDGGVATSAGLAYPLGVVADAAGNLYIAQDGNQVRRVDAATGIITTVAGNGTAGFSGDGGPASASILSAPQRVALDSSGNLLIADSGNARVRRVDAVTGVISTIAGGGTGGDGVAATSAQLTQPGGVTVDLAGNIYLTDSNRVRRVDAITGKITTVAGGNSSGGVGDGAVATTVYLNGPFDLASDASGSLYIPVYNDARVRFVDLATPQITLASTSANVSAAAGSGTATFTLTPTTASWTATSNASWLTLTTASGTGSGSAAYSYTANASFTSRSGAITIAGQTFTVNQAGAAASFSTTSATAATAGDTGTFTLTVTPAVA